MATQPGSLADVATQLGMQATELRSLVAASWQNPDKKIAAMKARIAKHFASNLQHVDTVCPRSIIWQNSMATHSCITSACTP